MTGRAFPFWVAIALSAAALAAAFLVTDNPSLWALYAARWTARSALPLFLIAFLASSLLRLWPSDITRKLVRYRRQWGLAFAVAFTIHLAALLNNILLYRPREISSIIPGFIAYLMIYILAATSNNFSMRRLGKNWSRLHSFGTYYIWFIFTSSYTLRIVHIDPSYHLEGWVFGAAMYGALALKLYTKYGRRLT